MEFKKITFYPSEFFYSRRQEAVSVPVKVCREDGQFEDIHLTYFGVIKDYRLETHLESVLRHNQKALENVLYSKEFLEIKPLMDVFINENSNPAHGFEIDIRNVIQNSPHVIEVGVVVEGGKGIVVFQKNNLGEYEATKVTMMLLPYIGFTEKVLRQMEEKMKLYMLMQK